MFSNYWWPVSQNQFIQYKQLSIDSFHLNNAIEFLKYPKKINDSIEIHFGPHGYYMKYNFKNYTIKQDGNYTEKYCLSLLPK